MPGGADQNERNIMPITLKMDEQVAIVTLDEGENRFNMEFISTFLEILDKVENETEAQVLLVTGGHEKIFSNGIDLDWLMPLIEAGKIDKFQEFIRSLMGMFKRVLMFPMPTVLAINGHAFAGGAIMACYFDFRFMRSDRGFFCFPEVDINIPFLPGMLSAMKKALPRHLLEEMTITGCRLTAAECEQHNIIRKACPMESLMDEAMAFAKALKKKRATVFAIKEELNKDVLHAIEKEDPPVIESARFFV